MDDPTSALEQNVLVETGNDNSLEPGELSGSSTPKLEITSKELKTNPEAIRHSFKDGINQPQKMYQPNVSQGMYHGNFNSHFRGAARMRGHSHWNRGGFMQPRMNKNVGGFRNPMNQKITNDRNTDSYYKKQKQNNFKLRYTKTKPSLTWQINLNPQTEQASIETMGKKKAQKISESPKKKYSERDNKKDNDKNISEIKKGSSSNSRSKKQKSLLKRSNSTDSGAKAKAIKKKSKNANPSCIDDTKDSKKLKQSNSKNSKNLKQSKEDENKLINIEEKSDKKNVKKSEKSSVKKSKTPDILENVVSTTPPPKIIIEKETKNVDKISSGKDIKVKKGNVKSKSKTDFRLSFVDDLDEEDIEVPNLNEHIDKFPLTKDESICAIDSKKQEKKQKNKLSEKEHEESSPDTDEYQDMWEEENDLPLSKESPIIDIYINRNIPKSNSSTKNLPKKKISPKSNLNVDNEIKRKALIIQAKKMDELITNEVERNLEIKSKLTIKDITVKGEIDYEPNLKNSNDQMTSNLLNLNQRIDKKKIELNKNEEKEKLPREAALTISSLNSNQNKELTLYSPEELSSKSSATSSNSSRCSSSNSSTTSTNSTTSSSSSSYSSEDEQNNLSNAEIRDGLGTPIFVNPSPPTNLDVTSSVDESNTPPLTPAIQQAITNDSLKDVESKINTIENENEIPEKNPTKPAKLLFGMQDIYEQFIQSVNNAGINLAIEQTKTENSSEKIAFEKITSEKTNPDKVTTEKLTSEKINSEKMVSALTPVNIDIFDNNMEDTKTVENVKVDIKIEPKKSLIEIPKLIIKEPIDKFTLFTPTSVRTIKATKSPFPPSSSDTDSTSDSDSDSDSCSDSSISSSVSEDEILTIEDKKKLRALEKRLNTLNSWTAADEDEKKCFEGLQKLIQNEINLVKCKYEEKADTKIEVKIPDATVAEVKKIAPPVSRIVLKIPAVLQQIPMQLPSDKLLSQRNVPVVAVPQQTVGGFTVPMPQIFSIEKEMSKESDKKAAEKEAKLAKEKENRDSKESTKSRRKSPERHSSKRRSPAQRRSSPQHSKQKKMHSISPSRNSKSSKKSYSSRSYKSDRRSRSRTRSPSNSKRFRSNRIERKPSPPSSRSHIRSKSPVTPRNFKRRSLSPQEYRRPSSSARVHSISPPRRRSISPPRRRSISPRSRSISPRRRSVSPRRRSVSPRRRSVSPRRRSVSPRRRYTSPRMYSRSPISFRPPSPPSPSPAQKDSSRSPIHFRNSPLYIKRFDSKSRSISPEYNRHRNHPSLSPKWTDDVSNQFYSEDYQYVMSPRQESAYQSYNPQFNSYSDYMPTLAESAYSSYEFQYSQTSDYSSCSSFDNQSYYYNDYQMPNETIMQLPQIEESQTPSNIRDIPVVKETSALANSTIVQKGNMLEIVPTVSIPQIEETKILLEEAKTENEEKNKMSLWKEEVSRRQVLSAVLKLNRESDGGVLKSILCKISTEPRSKERKKVLFADGVEPGNGPNDEKAPIVKPEKKKRKKKIKVIPPVVQEDKENVKEIVDPELENAEPPPPPLGSPLPHLQQPTLIRPPSPDVFLYFHYDPVVNSLYVSQMDNAVPPRLWQRQIAQKNAVQPNKNPAQSSLPQVPRKQNKIIANTEKFSGDKNFGVAPSLPPNAIGNFYPQQNFITRVNTPPIHQRIGNFPAVPNFFNAPPPTQYQQATNISLNRVPCNSMVGVQSASTVIKSDNMPAFSSDSVCNNFNNFFSKKDINTNTNIPGVLQKFLRNESVGVIGSPPSSTSSSPLPNISSSPILISSSPILSKLNFSNLKEIPMTQSVEEKTIEIVLDEIDSRSKNTEHENELSILQG